MPRKEKIVVELSPEVVALLKRIADAIAPEHHAPPIGETKRLLESDQRDHPVKWVPPQIKKGPTGYGQIELDPEYVESVKLTLAEAEQIEAALSDDDLPQKALKADSDWIASEVQVRRALRQSGVTPTEDSVKAVRALLYLGENDAAPKKSYKWWDNIEPGVD